MRISFAFALMASLLFVTACTRESEPGGPGATPGAAQGPVDTTRDTDLRDTTPHDTTTTMPRDTTAPAATPETRDRGLLGTDRDDNTFTLQVPRTAHNVQQGASESVSLSIDRGSAFNQTVTLSFEAPEGVTVSPDRPTIGPDVENADITVQVAPTAAIGRHQIKVTATPESGRAVDMMMEIDVTQP